jgi:Holliday junction resolvase RusA-like endonuclease
VIPLEVVFTIPGDPIPKGSLKCVGKHVGGAPRLVEDNPRTRAWRRAVRDAVVGVASADLHEPIGVEITATLPRPAFHYGVTGLRSNAPIHPTNGRTGDVDKLARLVLDALTDALVLVDDAQVVDLHIRKTFPMPEASPYVPDVLDHPGILLRVFPMPTSGPIPGEA